MACGACLLAWVRITPACLLACLPGCRNARWAIGSPLRTGSAEDAPRTADIEESPPWHSSPSPPLPDSQPHKSGGPMKYAVCRTGAPTTTPSPPSPRHIHAGRTWFLGLGNHGTLLIRGWKATLGWKVELDGCAYVLCIRPNVQADIIIFGTAGLCTLRPSKSRNLPRSQGLIVQPTSESKLNGSRR